VARLIVYLRAQVAWWLSSIHHQVGLEQSPIRRAVVQWQKRPPRESIDSVASGQGHCLAVPALFQFARAK